MAYFYIGVGAYSIALFIYMYFRVHSQRERTLAVVF